MDGLPRQSHQGRGSVHIETLGRLAIVASEWDDTGSPAPPVRSAVLVFLAVERDVSREETMALFWPESPPRRARHSLNQVLHRLRTDLGTAWLRTAGGRLRTTAAVQVDVHLFLDAIEAGALTRAVSMYEGRFLQGARLADSRPFEEWVDRWDARLARRFREATRSLIEETAATGDVSSALDAARGWIALDPFSREGHHRVIELLAASGSVSEAKRHYERVRRMFEDEELEPPEATPALAEALRKGGAAPPPLPLPEAGPVPPADPALPVSRSADRRTRIRRRSWPLIALGVVLAGLAVAVPFVHDSTADAPDGPRVLVAPLENLSGDAELDPLGRMASDWIGQTTARQGIRVIPTPDVLLELSDTGTDLSADARAQAVAVRYRADLLVTGHYTVEGDVLIFRSQVSDLRSGDLWGPLPAVRAPADSPAVALERVEQRVAGLLASQIGPGISIEPATVLHPPTLDAYEAFLRGIERFVQRDNAGALPHLERAFALDPAFIRAALVAASARSNLGDLAGADSIARLLDSHGDQLAPYEAAHLRWLRAALSGDLVSALEAAMSAADLAWGGPITGVAVGLARDLGRPELALELVDRIDPYHGWAVSFYGSYLEKRTGILHVLGRHREELETARDARRTGRSSLIGILGEVRALAALGRLGEIRGLVAEAAGVPPADGFDRGTFLSEGALEVLAHGDTTLARDMFTRAVEWYATRAGEEDGPHNRVSFARTLFAMGADDAAREEYRRLLDLQPDRLSYQGALAVLDARLGDARAARSRARALADPDFVYGQATMWRARVEAVLAQWDRAGELVRQALREGYRPRFSLHTDPDLGPLLRDGRF